MRLLSLSLSASIATAIIPSNFISFLWGGHLVHHSATFRLVAHFRRQARGLLDLHCDAAVWLLLLVLLPDLGRNSLLSQVLRLARISVNEDHVLHVFDTLVAFSELALGHGRAFRLRCVCVANASRGDLHGGVDLDTVSHRRLHGPDAHRALNRVVHGVQRRILCHVGDPRTPLATADTLPLGLQVTRLWLAHFHSLEDGVL